MESRMEGMTEDRDIKVTAVVPVHNSASYIEETLHSLIDQRRRFDEIIIVDDGSTDDTVTRVMKYPVRILRMPHMERSAARNAGWRAAAGDIIAFIESDGVYESDWLREVMKAFDEGHRAVIDRRRMYKPVTYYALMNDHIYDLLYADYEPTDAWIMEKELLARVDGFDESLHIAEDKDLADRLKAAGVTIYCARNAVHYHKGEPVTFRAAVKRFYEFGRGMFDYWWKDPCKRSTVKLASLLAFFWGTFCPPVFIYVFIKIYAKRMAWALRSGMKARYLPVEPFLYTVCQYFLQAGASVTLLRHLFIDKKLKLSWKGLMPAVKERT